MRNRGDMCPWGGMSHDDVKRLMEKEGTDPEVRAVRFSLETQEDTHSEEELDALVSFCTMEFED